MARHILVSARQHFLARLRRLPTDARALQLALGTFVLLALFPFGWLGQRWPAFGRWLDAVFASELAHLLGHTAIFGGLGLGALIVWPRVLRRPAHYAALIGALAVGQELLQKLHKPRTITGNDLLDLAVDLAAGAAVFVLARRWAGRSEEASG